MISANLDVNQLLALVLSFVSQLVNGLGGIGGL
jgi:hypothetical protein